MAQSSHRFTDNGTGSSDGASRISAMISRRTGRRMAAPANDNQRPKAWRWVAAVSAILAMVFLFLAGGVARAADIAGKDMTVHTSVRDVRVIQFKAPGEAKRPIVMMLHGGAGWGPDNKRGDVDHYASELANRGFDAYLIYYYDADDAKVMADQATRGGYTAKRFPGWSELLSKIAVELRKDPQSNGKLAFLGFSNGGNLSAHATPHDPSINAAVIYYGGVSRTPGYTPARFPPLLIMHGEADTRQPMALGKALYDQAKAVGADATFVTFPGENHGFGENLNRKAAADAFERAVVFLNKNLKS